ncbi:MAG: tyrosine-type recombinase/integrase [Smithella sp.]|nr:tyrosine-type recombinase/integrase [Smithella sp.]
MAALLDAINPATVMGLRNRAMLELLYATGLRSAELLGLTVDNLNLSDKTLFIHGKGAKDRIVPVGSWVVPWLSEYLQTARPKLITKRSPCDLLFVSKTGRRIPHANLCYIVAKYAVNVALPMLPAPHAFRHACATHLLAHGADIRYIQELLGHACLGTTQIYTRVDITMLKQAHGKYHPREAA